MNPTMLSFVGAFLFCVTMFSPLAVAGDRPLSGRKVSVFEPIDHVVLNHMDTMSCQAATVAVSKDGRLLYSRGYGWSDEAKTKTVPPNALMRIASVTKPITAAAVKNA